MATQEQFCENCGAANAATARFCQYCASPLPFKHVTGTLPEQTLLNARYQLETRIGQGGMGAVYKAIDTRFNNRPIAIKEMSRAGLSPSHVQEAEDAFERESQILSDLLHPNLPRIYDHFSEDERSYLVMDFIEGQTLEDYLDKASGSPLPLEQVLGWGVQLCDVLNYLHTHQPPIIFRDLKPSNVMISESGHIFLIDFGIARIFKPGQSHDTMALGSPGFAAPEQYGKAQSTPRSDIYSLGALLHNLLTGVDPSEQPFFFRAASHLNPAIPPVMEQLLQQMLQMDSELRPASIQDVLKVLRQVEQQRITGSFTQAFTATSLSQSATLTAGVPRSNSDTVGGSFLQDAYRLYTQWRLNEALAMYDRALQSDSRNPLAWQGRGLTLARNRQHQEALASFEQALKLDPNLVISLNGKGTALNILRHNKEALDVFDKVLLLEKDNVIAWNGKGAVQSSLGLPEQALFSFDTALHFDPRMSQAWSNKGLVLRQLKRYTDSLRAFEKSLELDPKSVPSLNGKGMVLFEMGRAQGAIQSYQEALRLEPRHPAALSGIGEVLYSQRKPKAALDHFDQALASDRRFVKAWEKRALVLSDMGRLDDALASYDQALNLDKRYAPAWNGKASVLCSIEQYQQALDAYNQALVLNPNAAQAWNGKGNASYHLNDYEMALDAYDRALNINPRMISAWHNKSLVLRQLERHEEALDAAEQAIRLAPKDSDNWQRKAEALRKLRRRRDARLAEAEVARLRGNA